MSNCSPSSLSPLSSSMFLSVCLSFSGHQGVHLRATRASAAGGIVDSLVLPLVFKNQSKTLNKNRNVEPKNHESNWIVMILINQEFDESLHHYRVVFSFFFLYNFLLLFLVKRKAVNPIVYKLFFPCLFIHPFIHFEMKYFAIIFRLVDHLMDGMINISRRLGISHQLDHTHNRDGHFD